MHVVWDHGVAGSNPAIQITLMKRKLIKMLTITETIILSLILGLLVMIPILSVLLLIALNTIALLIIGVLLYIVIVGFSIKMFNYDKD